MSRRKGRRERRKAEREERRQKRSEETGGLEGAYQFHKVYKQGKACCKNTRWKRSVQAHELHLFSGTARTAKNVISGKNRWKKYTHFTVSERGKTRPIDAPHVSDRHTQKVLAKEILLPLLEPNMIYNNGASLPDKGLALARSLLKRDLIDHYRLYGFSGWVISSDCEKFFPSAPHETIRAQHAKFIYDQEARRLADSVLDTIPSGVGVPLGVEPSQIEMVALPSPVDNYMKCQMRLKGFGHYMDDYYILVPPDRDPKQVLDTFKKQAAKLGIKISERKTHIVPFGKQFRFCKAKYTIKTTGRVVINGSRDSIKRARRKLKLFRGLIERGEMSYTDLWSATQGVFNYYDEFNDHGRTLRLRRLFYAIFGFSSERREEFLKQEANRAIPCNQEIQNDR